MRFVANAKTIDNAKLQERLTRSGYAVTVDGIYGRETDAAVSLFRKYHGLADTKLVVREGDGAYEILFPELVTKGKPTMFGINLKGLFSSMVFWAVVRYGVAAVSQFLAVKFNVDQGELYGVIFQVITLVAAGFGVTASAQSKVVVDGQKVLKRDLPPQEQAVLKEIVETNK